MRVAWLLVAAVACGGQSERDAALDKRVRALEKRVAELKTRTRELERTQDALVEQGQELTEIRRRQGKLEGKLERTGSELENQGSDVEHKKPSADVVYSVPLHDSPTLGPKVAKVTLVATLDFTEKYSKQLWPILIRLRDAFGDDLRLVWKPFVVRARDGVLPALAACAAGQQGKLPEMAELLFDEQGDRADWSADHLRELAGELQLEQGLWEAAFTGTACKAAVERDQRMFEALGQHAAPASWINGRFVSGAQSFDGFRKIIEAEVAKADAYLGKRGARLDRYYSDLVKTSAKSP